METTVKERLIAYLNYKGIGQNKFEKEAGISNGYISNIKKNIGSSVLTKIFNTATDLNESWLLTGEGEMLRGGVTQTSHGDNSPNVLGNGNRVSVSSSIDRAVEEFAQQRKLMERSQEEITEQRKLVARSQEQVSKTQEQIDRLITLIERMQKS